MRWIINIVSNYLKFLINMVIVFFLTPFVIAKLGMDLFGLWTLIFSIIGIFGLMDFGFATAAVKYVAESAGSGDFDKRNRILSTLLVVYSTIGLICLGLVAVAAGWADALFDLTAAQRESFTSIVWILGIVVALGFPGSLFKAAMVGSGRMDLVNAVELCMVIINAILIVTLLSQGYGLMGLAISTGVTMLGVSLSLIPLAYRYLPDFSLSFRLFSGSQVRELMSFSVYAFIANIAMLIILRIDPLVIGMFLPLSAVAIYAIAAKIGEYSYLLNKQFSNALMPLVSQSKGAGKDEIIRRVLIDGSRFLMAIALPFIALLYVYADNIILLWVGDEFETAIPLLKILLVAVFLSTIQLNAANVLGMTGHHRFVAFAMGGSAALNLALSIILIQFWGLPGVALATLIAAFTVEVVFMVPRACRSQGITSWLFLSRGVLPALPAAVPMLGLAWWLGEIQPAETFSWIVLEGAACAVVYVFFFIWTGVKRHERQTVVDAIRSRLPKKTSHAVG
ncbi:MAG: flippase [Mariprofundaceae bacterium]